MSSCFVEVCCVLNVANNELSAQIALVTTKHVYTISYHGLKSSVMSQKGILLAGLVIA